MFDIKMDIALDNTQTKLETALRQAKICEGDTVLCHCSLLDFNEPALCRKNFCQYYLDALSNVIGSHGVIVLPAFSYSFCNGKVFNIFKSKTAVNTLANYCLSQKIGFRTVDPNISYILVSGDLRNDLSSKTTKELSLLQFNNKSLSSGPNTILDFLLKKNAKYLMLGSHSAMTLIHNIEHHCKVPYRFFKKFSGTIILDHSNHGQNIEMFQFVRLLVNNTIYNLANCYKWANKYPINQIGYIAIPFANSYITTAPISNMVEAYQKLSLTEWFSLMNGPALSLEEIQELLSKENPVNENTIPDITYPVVNLDDVQK